MEMGVWLPWLCVLGLFAAITADQCHNTPCRQTNFRDYSNCIQSSCSNNNNCQCSSVTCNTCQTSDQCCQRCCQNTNIVQSGCSNSCQGSNCQTSNCQSNNCQTSNCQSNCQTSNCQSNCQTAVPLPLPLPLPLPAMTCANINCRTCRGEECMGCCEYRVTTEQIGLVNPLPSRPQSCNVTNIFRPNIPMPNITITINQPPIHITTGPVLNNISVPCPNPGSLTCPTQNNTIVVVQSNSTGCCQIPSTRCVQTNNPVSPYCYNYPQSTCGPRCQVPQPLPYVPPYIPPPPPYVPPYIPPPQPYIPPYIPPPQPQYIIRYMPAPPPIQIPTYNPPPPTQCPTAGCPTAAVAPQYIPVPQPQYIPAPQPQYIPAPQPQYIPVPQPQYYQPQPNVPPRQPCPWYGCQTPCVGNACAGAVAGGSGGYQLYPSGSNPQGCVGQWPYIRCGGAVGGGIMAAVPLGGAQPYPYNMATSYGSQYILQPNGSYSIISGDPSLKPNLIVSDAGTGNMRKTGTKRSGDDYDDQEEITRE